MNILLAAATVTEIGPFLEQYRQTGMFRSANHPIDILITGIGLTAATHSFTKQIYIKRPDLVIQAGIAGCFDPAIPVGTVLAVRQEAMADLGVTEQGQWKTLFDLGLVRPNEFPFSNGWLINKNDVLKKVKLKKVKAVSVNEITSNAKKNKLYRQLFSPVTESMEGAALHYVCLREKIPFLQLRSVSNYTGDRNKKNWKIKESVISLNKELDRLLQQL